MNHNYKAYGLFNGMRLWGRDKFFQCKSILQKNDKNGELVICNSYPKSGTHLLAQILLKIEGINKWNDIISVQSLSGVMNTENHISYKYKSAPSNSLIKSHLMCSSEIIGILNQRNHKRIFIYRDLRDVAVSHANWVLKEPQIFLHDLYHNYYETWDRQLMASIKGTPIGTPITSNLSQPDIATDFSRWLGWFEDENTYCVKFEDLVGERGGGNEEVRINKIKEMYRHLGRDIPNKKTLESFNSYTMDPNKSHTFRKGRQGKKGGWKEMFNEEHKKVFKNLCGDTLIKLGYEKDKNW